MSERAAAYRFKTRAQWQRCLLHGFDPAAGGTLQPIPRFGATARQVTSDGPISLVAADLTEGPLWRLDAGGRHALMRRGAIGNVTPGHELTGTLAHAPRWMLDRHSLWSFDVDTAGVRRYDRDTLQDDIVIDLGTGVQVRDLATDATDGAWALLETATDGWWLQHVDCEGRARERHPVPPEVRHPFELVTVSRGRRLIVLTSDGRLALMDAADGRLVRIVSNWSDDPCRRAQRITSDGVNRIVLLCHYCGDATRWALFVLDEEADPLDLVIGPQDGLKARPKDVAIVSGDLWLGADDGLWHLGTGEAFVARESESVLLTPALLSPVTGTDAGWLRAEIAIDLPRGAAIEAKAFTAGQRTDLAREAVRIAGDRSRSAEQRRKEIVELFPPEVTRTYHVTANPGKGLPIAIPLFGTPAPMLWLQLTLLTPPGVTPPRLDELRVLYPDASLIQHIPAIFRSTENDPTGFLRSLVGVLETTTQGIDAKIRSIAAHIDPGSAPGPFLDYLAGWLGLPWENALSLDAKRRLAQAGGGLLERRGTRQGLERLLRALAGPAARIRVVDLTVDHPPVRLAGGGCGGGRLPLLLAGPSPAAPILGSNLVLGRACLGVPCDPLWTIVPTLRVEVQATRTVRAEGPLIERIVRQYVPAGIKVVFAWSVVADALANGDDDGDDVIDANGPGRIGADSELGRVVLGGRGGPLDGAGLDVGFPLS